MQNLKQMFDEMLSTQEARFQSQWKDQFQTFMASMEAKSQTHHEKAKAVQEQELEASTPHSQRRPLFRANPGITITTNEGSSKGNSFVQKHSSMRLDIPKFGGADPQQWNFNIQEYFNFHQTPENQRLQIVGFCLEGDASE
nr:prolyl oligopeptidase family protein [Ipomoea batatas]